MKSSLTAVTILFSVIITSCTSYNPSMLSVEKSPNSVLLKRMEIVSKGNFASVTEKTISVAAPDYTIFQRNLEGNWMENSKKSFGEIEFALVGESYPTRAVIWPFLAGFTLGVSTLIGLPYQHTRTYFLEYQVNIFDVTGRKVKSYNYISNKKFAMALYYGQDLQSYKISVIHDIMSQISEDLLRDAANINDELIDAIE